MSRISRARKIGWLIIIAAIIVILVGNFFHGRNAVIKVFQPIQFVFYRLNLAIGSLFSRADLKQENQKLKQENINLKKDLLASSFLQEENTTLRKALNLRQVQSIFAIPAQVFSFCPLRPGCVMINRGEQDKVQIGDSVVDVNQVLIGRITRVENNFSEISLLSASDSALVVKVGQQKQEAILRGAYGLGLEIDFLSQEVKCQSGDFVVSAGKQGKFLPDLLIGQIELTAQEQALVFSLANFSQLKDVLILKLGQ